MRILACSRHIPYPLTSGGALRKYNISKELSKNNPVYLFYLKSYPDNTQDIHKVWRSRGIFEDCFSLELPKSSLSGRAGIFPIDQSILSRILTLNLSGKSYPRFKEIIEAKIKNIIEEYGVDIIHCYGLYMGLMLADLGCIPKVLDLVDCTSLYYKRELRFSKNPVELFSNCYKLLRAARIENYLLGKFDATTVVSPVDMWFLRRLNTEANIRTIRNGVDVKSFSPWNNVNEDYPSILFSGNMSYSVNIDAALYIHREILPLIRSEVANIKFYIVGKDPHYKIKKLAKDNYIVVTGFVKNLGRYISRCSVVLAPMRKGTGVKNKILEAMALGKPVVTTPTGAGGLDQGALQCLVIGTNAEEIAQKTIELLRDGHLRSDLGRRASEIIRQRYTWKACAIEYEKLYNFLCTHT